MVLRILAVHFVYNNRQKTFIKCINNQQTHFKFKMDFYLYYLHQHVSASNPAIFRVMVLIKDYDCS